MSYPRIKDGYYINRETEGGRLYTINRKLELIAVGVYYCEEITKILLLQREKGDSYKFPGGHAEMRDIVLFDNIVSTMGKACRREFSEETGCLPIDMSFIGRYQSEKKLFAIFHIESVIGALKLSLEHRKFIGSGEQYNNIGNTAGEIMDLLIKKYIGENENPGYRKIQYPKRMTNITPPSSNEENL